MNIKKLRLDTPGIKHVTHFNNAGASLMTKPVVDIVTSYLEEEVKYGGYETMQKNVDQLASVYTNIASLINANINEIALLENATSAWNMGFFSIDFEEGDRILTSVAEYGSNFISYLRLQKNKNVSVEVIPNDETGQTSVTKLRHLMDERVRLISITHMPTNSGLINPVEEIGSITREYDNCLYLVDACQSVGQYPVDVQKIGCDLLSATGRKYLRAPRGTGFLYVKQDRLSELHPPFPDVRAVTWTAQNNYTLRNDAKRFENWENNYAAIMGLGKAVDYAVKLGITNIRKRIELLATELREKLSPLPGVTVTDIGKQKSGIVTFTMNSLTAKQIWQKLAQKDINVSISSQSSTLLDMQQRKLKEVVRASLHYYNTPCEIDLLINELRALN